MTQAEQALETINAYMAGTTGEDVRTQHRNLWEKVIQVAEGYNEEMSAEADPSEMNEEAVFTDGSRLW